MTKKKRLYLSVLIPLCLFLAVLLTGVVYMLLIRPHAGGMWMGEPPKESHTYSMALHFLEELFSPGNFVRLTAFSGALGFALWHLPFKRRNRATSLAFLVCVAGFGILLSAVPLLFALLIPVSDTMAFAIFGLADLLDGIVYPLARVLLFVAAAISISRLLSLYRDGLTASP